VTDATGEQGSLFDLYSELAQPEDCIDCHILLDGRELKVNWDYCEFCGESVCGPCDASHACEPMRKTRPNRRRP
jgi:hypothetical protein